MLVAYFGLDTVALFLLGDISTAAIELVCNVL